MSQKLWVQYETPARIFGPTQVCIDGCEYVDGFLKEIKKEFSNTLGSYDSSHLTLYTSDGITEIDVGASPADYVTGNSRRNALIVRIVEIPEKPSISSSRHKDYKHSKAIHSSRSYLTSIAVELEKLFALEKTRPREPATFGDVLWNSRRTPHVAPKIPNLPELCHYFTNQEWTFLEDLNSTVNPALHSELDIGIDGKTREVVLPIQLSHLGATCQRIAKKAKVVNNVSDLIVKNEGSV